MKQYLKGCTEVTKGVLGSYSIFYKECEEEIKFYLEVDQLGWEDLGRNYGITYSVSKNGAGRSREVIIEENKEKLVESLKLFMSSLDKNNPCVKLD